MDLEEKRKFYHFGLLSEHVAALFLQLKFYKIIERRYKCKLGEVDLIARKGNKVVFIEVKARKDTSLMDFISIKQKNRIIKAAEYFILTHPKYKNYQVSFDVVIVNGCFYPQHIQNYW